jgi:predicted RNA-binding Zn-ribbon protein involved in translation (DUF1610 family)
VSEQVVNQNDVQCWQCGSTSTLWRHVEFRCTECGAHLKSIVDSREAALVELAIERGSRWALDNYRGEKPMPTAADVIREYEERQKGGAR